MLKIAMSAAASNLLRALIARAGVPRDRILLTELQSTDWQSLTLTGERHVFALRVLPPHSDAIVERMCAGLADAEFSIPDLIVADIGVMEGPVSERGSSCVTIEALTIEE
jgi:hypothetical protein